MTNEEKETLARIIEPEIEKIIQEHTEYFLQDYVFEDTEVEMIKEVA